MIYLTDLLRQLGPCALHLHFSTGPSISLMTQSGAKYMLDFSKEFLTKVNQVSEEVGSFVSRFESAARNLKTTKEAYSAAESQIADADVAQETAALVRSQMLQQAGASILAQANLAPRLALQLLQA